ncbi:ribosome recycling factor [Patescibacteria group bacterium]|nr:ribosome recycling factor [Patescibacteria group bacterium]
MDFIKEAQPQFAKVTDRLYEELNQLRTGRATPALAENIQVEAYGTMQPIKALASMSTPDSKTLVIEPWDGSVVKAIETAIVASDIGIMPVVDGKVLRLIMPMMTEESRMKMVKIMKEKLEDARVAARRVREEARKKIGAQDVSEDDIKKEQDALDKVVKEVVAKIDEMGEKKEAEIMKV